jgi:dipeptidyl aminopeptidase/acylaminoacyl peptidase
MKRITGFAGLVVFFLWSPLLAAEAKRPMVVEDLFRFRRVADPQISPDGKQVIYTLTSVDLAANKTSTNLWLAAANGMQKPRQLTATGKHDRHPRWSLDGQRILFESDRSGENQLWIIDLSGGEARQLTTIASEASNAVWSPDGRWIAFVSAVYPEYSSRPYAESNALNRKRKEEAEKSPVKARVFTKLFFRHWNEWVEDRRQHLFVIPASGGEPKDVTPGDRDAFPTSDTFSSGDNFTFSPDSRFLVFTAVPEKNPAWSTNHDICRVPITGGTENWECLTKENPAADASPQFSPNGKKLAYRAQRRPGFEADRWEILVVDCDPSGAFSSRPRSATDPSGGKDTPKDLSVTEFTWAGQDDLAFTADERGSTPLFQISVSHPGAVATVVGLGANSSISASRDGRRFACLLAEMTHPPEVITGDGELSTGLAGNISHANDPLLAELDLPKPESVTLAAAGGTPMQMWILKPPGFDAGRKWPLAFLVHGGPQGAWEDGWSYRWNPELWAAQGYVVALPNPRGSTGFGQKYVNEISGDWGGKCYEDLMAALAYLEKQPWIDPDRMAAAGASFGGYMMNWFEGHTTKFKTLISHCGVYNFDSMYATTDELWFDEWEHGGPPWGGHRESYEKFSPHRFAAHFQTPMLLIQNDLDFRCPVSEGLQLFTTLQRKGIPSKLINFPDEGHWVLKPANSAYWHREVFAWLKKYSPPGGRP